MNKEDKKPFDLSSFMEVVEIAKPDYTNVVGQDDLNRFEHTFKKKKKKKKNPNRNSNNSPANKKEGGQHPKNQNNSKGPSNNRRNSPKNQNKGPKNNNEKK